MTTTVLILAAVLAGVADARTPAERPNIVLVISDDHDYEHFGFQGHSHAHTPTLDRLAEAGTVFTTGHLPMSRCHPTLASFLSGRWPHQTGIYYNYGTEKLAPTNSLPNLLKQAGYATYVDGKYWEGDPRAMGFSHGRGRDPQFVREGQEDLFAFVDEVADRQPFFVWYAPRIPHTPHNPPEKYRQLLDPSRIAIPAWFAGDVEEYRAKEHTLLSMVAWLDDGLGAFIEKLQEKGEKKDTLFAFVLDNGWSNGLVSKGSPFEKGVRTPILFHWPGHVEEGQRFDHLVSTLDVYPTLLDYAGVPVPETAAGRSLRPILEGKPAETRKALYGAIYPAFATRGDERPEGDVYALYARTKKWKYILYVQDVIEDRNRDSLRIQSILTDYPTRSRGDQDLYDLVSDPYELNNLGSHPENEERLRQFKRQALNWWKKTDGKPLDVTSIRTEG